MAAYADPTEQLVVEVFVRDIARAKAFYEQLGFEVLGDHGAFVALAWEGCQLYLAERRDLPPPPEHPQANVRIMVPDVDSAWARAGTIGARILDPIADREYGLRDFTIADPEGFAVRFGTVLSGGEAERAT